jgi:hypothetical protein
MARITLRWKFIGHKLRIFLRHFRLDRIYRLTYFGPDFRHRHFRLFARKGFMLLSHCFTFLFKVITGSGGGCLVNRTIVRILAPMEAENVITYSPAAVLNLFNNSISVNQSKRIIQLKGIYSGQTNYFV